MNTVLRVGIVGLGRAGQGMQAGELAALPKLFKITAGCDVDEARHKDLPPAFEGATLYSNYDEMLKDESIDLVAIATRHADHAPMAIKALKAGKYVSEDKPCALNTTQMDKLVEVARAYPGRLFLRHNHRFDAPFLKTRRLIGSGVLGTVNTVKFYRSVGYCRRNDWMTLTSQGGGLFTNWGPHIVDQALQLLESRVVDCWADIKSVISIGDGDDHIKVLLRAENGRVADIEISGAHTLPGREIEIQGSRGTLVYPVDGKIKMRFVDPDFHFRSLEAHAGRPPLQYGNLEENLTFVEQLVEVPKVPGEQIWKHIYDSIVNGIPFPIRIEEGMEVVRVMEEAFKVSGFAPHGTLNRPHSFQDENLGQSVEDGCLSTVSEKGSDLAHE